MLEELKLLLGISDTSKDDLLELLLTRAEKLALRTMYPFEDDLDEIVLSSKYDDWLVSCAKEMYQNLGSENVKAYSENGLSITYTELSSGISKDLLSQLTPRAGVPK